MYHDLSLSLYQVLSTNYAPLFIALTKPHYAIPTRPSCCVRHCRICFARERKTTKLGFASNDRMEMDLFFTQFTSSWRTTEWRISWIPAIFSPITYFSQTPEPSVVKSFLLPFVLYHLDVSTCCHIWFKQFLTEWFSSVFFSNCFWHLPLHEIISPYLSF